MWTLFIDMAGLGIKSGRVLVVGAPYPYNHTNLNVVCTSSTLLLFDNIMAGQTKFIQQSTCTKLFIEPESVSLWTPTPSRENS